MSPRYFTTNFGEPLSAVSQKIVSDVRMRLSHPIHRKFDNDFNIYRFVINAERNYKNHNEIVEHAAKTLTEHLKVRHCMGLDELPDIPFEENRIFAERFLPCGRIQEATDSSNRILWFIEYATISVEGIAHGMRSSESIRWQFRQFEHMLRLVNKKEAETDRLCSLRHIVDMNGYEINPFTMVFVTSGTLSYYSQLFHYDNYPELVYPIELVNIAKWIHMPYRVIKAMMPAGFSDRFRIHDGNFLPYLTSEMSINHIPITLGGKNEDVVCIPADKNRERNPSPTHPDILAALEPIHIPARKLRCYRIAVESADQRISWWCRTNGDYYFAVFYDPLSNPNSESFVKKKQKSNGHHSHHHNHHHLLIDHAELEVKEPVQTWFKLSAKLVDESDTIICGTPGVYYVVLSNKHSILQSRTVDVLVVRTDDNGKQWRHRIDGGCEPLANITIVSPQKEYSIDVPRVWLSLVDTNLS